MQTATTSKLAFPAVWLNTSLFMLRPKVKRLERDAKDNGHTVRQKMYHFIQMRIKKFVNWFYTVCSESTQAEMDRLATYLYNRVA